jgi:hypothetical protein
MNVDRRMTSRTPRTMATTVAAYPVPLVLFAADTIQYKADNESD